MSAGITIQGKTRTFEIDVFGFLLDPDSWEPDFALTMASQVGIYSELRDEHWQVIRSIRQTFHETGICPVVYQTCKANQLSLQDLKRLFPAGYLRGACRLAGITYRDAYIGHLWHGVVTEQHLDRDKVYRVNRFGFLVNPEDWDEQFARSRAAELKVPGGLTATHWKIIRFLRSYYEEHGSVANIYETCEAHGMELDDLEQLFPDGYHRGAIKLAGLRVL